MAGFKAAIFDMDGTLVESMVEWRKQNRYFCERNGVPVPEDIAKNLLATSSHKAAERYAQLYPELGMSCDEIINDFEQHLRPLYTTVIEKKKGIIPFLEMLRSHGVRMCVATATPSDIAADVLKHHGIAQYMEFIVSKEEVGMTKSNTAYFPKVAQMLGFDTDDAVVFEDALYAVKSAEAAGMRVFAVKDICAEKDWDEIAQRAVVLRDDYTGLQALVEAMFLSDYVCTANLCK